MGVLPLCREAVGVFYSPSRLGNNIFDKVDKEEETDQIILMNNSNSDISVRYRPNYIYLWTAMSWTKTNTSYSINDNYNCLMNENKT